jgi:hypothetical protein
LEEPVPSPSIIRAEVYLKTACSPESLVSYTLPEGVIGQNVSLCSFTTWISSLLQKCVAELKIYLLKAFVFEMSINFHFSKLKYRDHFEDTGLGGRIVFSGL